MVFSEDMTGKKPVGLVNLGNTCCMNSGIQCLLYSSKLTSTLQKCSELCKSGNENNYGECGRCTKSIKIEEILNAVGEMRVLKSLQKKEELFHQKKYTINYQVLYINCHSKCFLMRNYLDILPNWVPNIENDV